MEDRIVASYLLGRAFEEMFDIQHQYTRTFSDDMAGKRIQGVYPRWKLMKKTDADIQRFIKDLRHAKSIYDYMVENAVSPATYPILPKARSTLDFCSQLLNKLVIEQHAYLIGLKRNEKHSDSIRVKARA